MRPTTLVLGMAVVLGLLSPVAADGQRWAAPAGVAARPHRAAPPTGLPAPQAREPRPIRAAPGRDGGGRNRTLEYVVVGAVLGGVAGALVGRANAGDCANEGCVGYQDLSDAGGALRGAIIGVPVGALAGFVVARATDRRAAGAQ